MRKCVLLLEQNRATATLPFTAFKSTNQTEEQFVIVSHLQALVTESISIKKTKKLILTVTAMILGYSQIGYKKHKPDTNVPCTLSLGNRAL
jgi:hypothetical protein